MGDIVQGFVHGLDKRVVFIQHLVEKTDEFIEFAASGTRGHPSARIAGVKYSPYRQDQLPDGAHGAEGQKTTTDNTEQKQWKNNFEEYRSKVGQKLLAAG